MFIKKDCYYYLGNKPCSFHKMDGRLCKDCKNYKKIEENILIIKLDALGDVLRATSVLPALKNKYPNSTITWLTRRNALPLIRNNPFVYKYYAVEGNYLEILLSQKFDICINLDAESISGSIAKIVNAREKIGFIVDDKGSVIPANHSAVEWFEMGLNDRLKRANRKTYFEHMYRIIGLPEDNIHPPIIELTDKQIKLAKRKRLEYGLDKYRKTVGINTGGGKKWENKKWLCEYYIKLIRLLYDKYPDIALLLYGGPEEIEFNNKIIKTVDTKIINTGCTNTIEDFVSIVSLSDVFFTSDSLGMQVSLSHGIETIVIVGPTSPWELDVFGKGEIIYPQLECISCYLPRCDKNPNCMEWITPEIVFKGLKKYLE